MNDKIKGHIADCTMSLATALQLAGGRVDEKFLDMSVRELISEVAQNNIRFVYTGPDLDRHTNNDSTTNQ